MRGLVETAYFTALMTVGTLAGGGLGALVMKTPIMFDVMNLGYVGLTGVIVYLGIKISPFYLEPGHQEIGSSYSLAIPVARAMTAFGFGLFIIGLIMLLGS